MMRWFVIIAVLSLSACSAAPVLPVVVSPKSQEAVAVSVDVASAMSADVVDVLRSLFPPAKNSWLFLPPDAVFGRDLRDRLQSVGYGVVAVADAGGSSELFYTLDSIGPNWRLSVRIGSWRVDRLYAYNAQANGKDSLTVLASGITGGQMQGVQP